MQEFLPQVRRIADEAAAAILEVYQSSDFRVAVKEDFSPLTQADLASHRHIVAGLERLSPELPVLSEESEGITYDDRRHWDTFWLVDPLDGTKEFLRRNGEFTINIALIRAHRPVLGVVHLPVSGQTYWAAEGGGRVQVSRRRNRPVAGRANRRPAREGGGQPFACVDADRCVSGQDGAGTRSGGGIQGQRAEAMHGGGRRGRPLPTTGPNHGMGYRSRAVRRRAGRRPRHHPGQRAATVQQGRPAQPVLYGCKPRRGAAVASVFVGHPQSRLLRFDWKPN